MQDSVFSDPAQIRATYAARGRNAKLNVSKAESLGVNASQISPTKPGGLQAFGGGSVAGGGTGSSSSGGEIIDPTYYNDSSGDGTFEGSLYKQEPIGEDGAGIVV